MKMLKYSQKPYL